MIDLSATVLARIETKTGFANGVRLESGRIAVGDVVGLYVNDQEMPYLDAVVREIRHVRSGSVQQAGGEDAEDLSIVLSVFFENDPTLKVGTVIGPGYVTKAQRFGVKPEDLR